MEIILVTEIAIGLTILIVFFKMGMNVRKIRTELETGKLRDARINYYVNLTADKKDEARNYLAYIVFSELVPMADYPVGRKTLYNELKEKHTPKFEALGYDFPEDPFTAAETPAQLRG
jgi:cell division protein FtsX